MPTDTEAAALAWVDLLGNMASTCDIAAATGNRWATRRELDELDRRAARYRDLQLAALHNISIERQNSFTINR